MVIVGIVSAFLALLVLTAFLFRERMPGLLAYFLHSRNLKGFVLAMTLVATYGSVSTFVSGPGLAWHYGLSWVVFAAPQIVTGFFVLGILGYKLALISRKINAITLIDVIRARYDSPILCNLIALATLVFFLTMMAGQFIGGAQLLSYATGCDYAVGLLIFGVVTVFYTAVGGFRAVVLTDTICAVLMLAGMGFLAQTILEEGGGLTLIGATLTVVPEAGFRFMSFDSFGTLPIGMLLSAWILVGFATVALPQSAVRCMAFSKVSDLRAAMIIGTVVCGALMLGMTFIGALLRAVVPEGAVFGNNTDALIPYFISNRMDPWIAGLTLTAPLAATMSTVSSLLIAAAGTLIKDLVDMRDKFNEDNIFYAKLITFVFGVLSLLLAIDPQDVIAWINLFAFGGLEIAYLTPLVGGLFWARADARAATASVLAGFICYAVCMASSLRPFGSHAIVPALAVSIVVYVLMGFFAKRRALPVFFPESRKRF